MKAFNFRARLGVAGLLVVGLTPACGQSGDGPVLRALQPGCGAFTVEVSFPGWTRQVTLESRTNLQSGAWMREASQPVSAGVGTASFAVEGSMRGKFFRARATPGFLAWVGVGLALIWGSYPGALLYEVNVLTAAEATGPDDIESLRVVSCTQDGGTAMVTATSSYCFGPVAYDPHSWLGDYAIPWPVTMEASEADALCKQAGYTGCYSSYTLRHPVYPGLEQPYYIFCMAAGGYVFVGVNDKTVTWHAY